VLSALSKGAAINTFLEQILFQIFPVIVDLLLVIVPFDVSDDRHVYTFACILMHISL
jgi:ATP-binding cassette, subfamily B, vacuolar membrane transporter HMT1/ACLQ